MKPLNLKHHAAVAAALVSMLAGAGCDQKKITRFGESETYLGTHQITVRPGSPHVNHTTKGEGAEKVHEFTCAEHRVILDGRELIVNNRTYGEPPPRSTILIEYGKVFINGLPGTGKARRKAHETIDKREQAESATRLGGYSLKIRPGHMVKTRFHMDGAHTLRLGDHRYTVKGDEFFINDVSFGKLYPGDSILVDHGSVFVSDRERTPFKAGERD